MSKRCLLSAFSVRLSKSQAFAFALTAAAVCWAGVVSGKEAARLATFQSESGQTSFALSLFPEVEAKQIVRQMWSSWLIRQPARPAFFERAALLP